MIIRPMRDEELPEVLELNRVAFGGEEEVDMVVGLLADPGHLPEYNLVAERDGLIVGHALYTRIHAADGTPSLLLGPLAVLPAHQNSGVGAALNRQGIAQARESGETALFVYGDPRYYGRFGYSADAVAGVVPPQPYFAPGWQALTLDDGPLRATAGPIRVPAALMPEHMWAVPEEDLPPLNEL